MLFEAREIFVGGVHIHYETGGSGEPLVLLHGLSGSSRWWDKNTRALAEHFTVYVVDLIGFGRSRGQRFVLDQTPDLLKRWLGVLGLTHVNVIGHSMGGLISAVMASRYPGLIDRLVLVDAAAVPLGRSIITSAIHLPLALRYAAFDFLPVLISDALRAGPRTLLNATLAIHQADITADLSKIESRVLIVWGEHDELVPLARGEALHQALPKAEFVVIRGAGHNPMWDRADAFNRAVIDFLEQP